jgi:hypothetical protein
MRGERANELRIGADDVGSVPHASVPGSEAALETLGQAITHFVRWPPAFLSYICYLVLRGGGHG